MPNHKHLRRRDQAPTPPLSSCASSTGSSNFGSLNLLAEQCWQFPKPGTAQGNFAAANEALARYRKMQEETVKRFPAKKRIKAATWQPPIPVAAETVASESIPLVSDDSPQPKRRKRRKIVHDEPIVRPSRRRSSLGASPEKAVTDVMACPYPVGTAVKNLSESEGCWVSGKIVEAEDGNVPADFLCRLAYTRRNGSTEYVNLSNKDVPKLTKLVEIAKLRPGQKIFIFWQQQNVYYPATVLAEQPQKRRSFRVQYDDGEFEWINLWRHEFQFDLDPNDEAVSQNKAIKRQDNKPVTSSNPQGGGKKKSPKKSMAMAVGSSAGVPSPGKPAAENQTNKPQNRKDHIKSSNKESSMTSPPAKSTVPPKKRSNVQTTSRSIDKKSQPKMALEETPVVKPNVATMDEPADFASSIDDQKKSVQDNVDETRPETESTRSTPVLEQANTADSPVSEVAPTLPKQEEIMYASKEEHEVAEPKEQVSNIVELPEHGTEDIITPSAAETPSPSMPEAVKEEVPINESIDSVMETEASEVRSSDGAKPEEQPTNAENAADENGMELTPTEEKIAGVPVNEPSVPAHKAEPTTVNTVPSGDDSLIRDSTTAHIEDKESVEVRSEINEKQSSEEGDVHTSNETKPDSTAPALKITTAHSRGPLQEAADTSLTTPITKDERLSSTGLGESKGGPLSHVATTCSEKGVNGALSSKAEMSETHSEQDVHLEKVAVDVDPEQFKFEVGTSVKKFCERQSQWIEGRIARVERQDNNVVYGVEYSTETGVELVPPEIHAEDSEGLKRLVELAMIAPGTRLEIFWPDDNVYYSSTVTQERPKKKKCFFVRYDDDESEWINLWYHTFRVAEPTPLTSGLASTVPSSDNTEGPSASKPSTDTSSKKVATNEVELQPTEASSTKQKQVLVAEVSTVPNADTDQSLRSQTGTTGSENKEESSKGAVAGGKRVFHFEAVCSSSSSPKATPMKKLKLEKPLASVKPVPGDIAESKIPKKAKKAADFSEQRIPKKAVKPDDVGGLQIPKTATKVAVGMRVSIFWPDDNAFYTGEVTKRRLSRYPHFVEYDDGETEWINFNEHTYRIIDESGATESGLKLKKVASEGEEADAQPVKEPVESGPSEIKRKKQKKNKNKVSEKNIHEGKDNVDDDLSSVVVGTRIAIWWPDDRKYYLAKVQRKQPVSFKPYFVKYDDGEEEWIDLRRHKWRFASVKAQRKATTRSGSREKSYYNGIVEQLRDHPRPHYIGYDDGDKEWIDLKETGFYILDH